MYTKEEFENDNESVQTKIAKSLSEQIDTKLRKRKTFFSLGYIDNLADYKAVKKLLESELAKAGWDIKITKSTCRDDEGQIYVEIS